VLTGDNSGTAHVWEVAGGQPTGLALPCPGTVLTVAFSRDGKRMLTDSSGKGISGGPDTALLWDVVTGKPVGPPFHHPRQRAVQFNPDGQTFLTVQQGMNKIFQLWDAATGKPIGGPLPHQGSVPIDMPLQEQDSDSVVVSNSYG